MRRPPVAAWIACLALAAASARAAEPVEPGARAGRAAMRFDGFDTSTAYPNLPCEIRPLLFFGRRPYRMRLVEQTGGVRLDAERGLLTFSPVRPGQAATFAVRVTDAAGAGATRRGRVTCTAEGFHFVDGRRGSDDAPGTEGGPWKTIAKAAASLTAGQTALVRAGRYTEPRGPLGEGTWYRPALTPAHGGESGRPITFRAYPGETVVVDSTIGTAGGRNFVTWEGFVLAYGAVAKLFGVEGAVLRGIYLHGHTAATSDNHDGVRIQHARRFTVQDCHIRNVRGLSWNSAGIKVYKQCTGVVEHCRLAGSTVNVFDKDSSVGVVYRRNVFDRGDFLGNNQGRARNLRICENVFVHCGINLHTGAAGTEVSNNTIYGGGISSHSGVSAIDDARCWNNILWGMDVNFRWRLCDYNVYFHGDAEARAAGPRFRLFRYDKSEKKFRSLEAWRLAVGLDKHSRVADPQFVSASGGDFRLRRGARALTAGTGGGHVGAMTADGPVIGVRRPWRGRKPIPAEEARTAAAAGLLKTGRGR